MSLDAELQEVADEVRDLNKPAADRLDSLRLAIQPGADPAGWDAVDVLRAIDPAGTVAPIRHQRLWSQRLARLEWLRNMLALAPVLLTWIGLMVAADGYRAAIAADETLVDRPFLLLWQQGFEGHGSWLADRLTLGRLALLDAAVIGLMIVITWSIHGETNIRQATRERRAHQLEGRLHQVAWQAWLELGTRTSQAVRFDQLLNEIRAERQRIDKLAQERERRMAELRGFVDKFKEGAADFLGGTAGLQETLGKVRQIATDIDGRSSELLHQERNLASALTRFADEGDKHNQGQAKAGQTFDQAVARLSESVVLVSQVSAESVSATANIAATVGLVQAEIASLRTQLIEDRKAYATSAEAIRDSVRELEQTVGEISRASQQVKGLSPVVEQLVHSSTALYEQAKAIAGSAPAKDVLVEAGREVLREWSRSAPLDQNGSRPSKRSSILPWR